MSICGEEAFSGCKELKVVSMPDGIDGIGPSAFYKCEQLNGVYVPNSVLSVGDAAFRGCKKLRRIAVGNRVLNFGTSAFADCSMLLSVDRFSQSDARYPFDMVGDYSFAGTSLAKVNLSLRSSSIYTFWGDYCFADCKSLAEVNILSSCYMSNHMFANDTALTAVNFKNNHTSYVYPFVFENCTSLPQITLPSKIWYVSEGMFHNCSSLRTVKFSDYTAANSMVSLVQKNAFNGCSKLESIEFPASLNSLDYFKDACLSACSAKALNFHGLAASVLLSANNSVLTSDLMYGKVYNIMSNSPSAEAEVRKIVEIAEKVRAPICFFFNEGCYWHEDCEGVEGIERADCAANAAAFDASLRSASIVSQLAKMKVLFVAIDNILIEHDATSGDPLPTKAMLDAARAKQIEDFKAKTYTTVPACLKYLATEVKALDNIVRNIFVYQNRDGIIYGFAATLSFSSTTQKGNQPFRRATTVDINAIKKKLKSYQQQSGVTRCASRYEFSQPIVESGLLRLCHDCDIWTSDHQPEYSYGYLVNKPYKFTYDASKVKAYVEPIEYTSDKTTKTGFKVGKWYYNARQIKSWADSTHTPCLFIYSLLGCKPCQVYQENIWNNAEFQQWAAKQKFLLCGMEVTKQPYYDDALKFCVDELSPEALNYQKIGQSAPKEENALGETFKQTVDAEGNINSSLYTPVLVFYYNDGSTVKCYDHTYHSIDSWLRQFGPSGVIQCLKSLCLNYFDGNDLSKAKFTVDAGKKFKRHDWVFVPENPYKAGDDLITLNRWAKLKTQTTDGALEAMKKILSSLGAQSSSYPEYIGGCLWSDFDWISLTFDVGQLEEDNPATINLELSRFYVEIGDKYYKLQVSSTDKKVKIDTPCGQSTIYKYFWQETSYPK